MVETQKNAGSEAVGRASVDNWMSRVAPATGDNYLYHFEAWMKWMKENGGDFAGFTPDDLVEFQREATNRERYGVLDLIQRHASKIHGRHSYKMKRYRAVRSFFMHNRAELPQDKGFTLRAEVPPVVGSLTADEAKRGILSSKPVYQAIFLCMIQGGMGEGEIIAWSKTGYENLVEAVREVEVLRYEDRVVKVGLPGRKKERNKRPFYTYVGPDAIEALKNWLKRRPEDAEGIFSNQYGQPLNEHAMRVYWLRRLKKLGIIEAGEPGNTGNRYGKNLHELRDVFRSQWEKSPAKGSVAEFMLGHVVDPLEYNKAYRDEKWTRQEYMKALPMLQIMSSGRPFGRIDEDEVETLRRRVQELEEERKTGIMGLEGEAQEAITEFVNLLKHPKMKEKFLGFLQSLAGEEE